MTVIERDPDETAADTLARLADLTEGLPFEETDDDAALVERAIRLAHTSKGAVSALRKYGRHGAGCALMRSVAVDNTPRARCDCGWDEASTAIPGGQSTALASPSSQQPKDED